MGTQLNVYVILVYKPFHVKLYVKILQNTSDRTVFLGDMLLLNGMFDSYFPTSF